MDQTEKLRLLVNLAQEVEITDPIDWGMLAISEQDAYNMMATSVLEMFPDERIEIQAVIVKLTVENFVLNLKLMQR